MTNNILLAIFCGYVLRLIAVLGVKHYISISKDDAEVKSRLGFHFSIITYILGSILVYGSFALLIAYLIKDYI